VVTYDTDPAEITQQVQGSLARHALIPDDSDVAADTFGSAVRLTGQVRTWAEHDAVVSVTWMATGVTAVIDELEVTS
jgi:osmotically-inducible protein OsmY